MQSPTMVDPQSVLADVQDGMALTRNPLPDARQLPGKFYSSPDIAALEKEKIFLKTWLCVGRGEQFPNPGDYRAMTILDEPFILVRNTQGQMVAFMNMCLHRGVTVAEGTGNSNRFMCPYHAWIYDTNGRLVRAPRMQSTRADLSNCALKPLNLVEWRGWIFVSFNPDPVPFEEFIGTVEKELWWFQTDQTRLAEVLSIEVQCNWKLLIENLVDVYHVPVLHRGTFGKFVQASADDSFNVKLLKGGGWAYDQKAKSHSKTGAQTFPTLPWLEGMPDDTSCRAGLYPNINMSMRYDSLRMWQVWPVGDKKTRLDIFLLFAPTAHEDPNFVANLEDYKGFIRDLVGEDGTMVESLQNAMASSFYEPGPMSGLEAAVHHMMKEYLDALEAPAV